MEKEFKLDEKIEQHPEQDTKIIDVENIKEFIRWVESEIILKSPKARQNLIKLQKRVGGNLK